MNLKRTFLAVGFTLLLATVLPLRAQSGCVDSPEDPTIVLALVGTAVLATLVKVTIGLRPDAEKEEEGLDQVDHGEAGYHMDQATGG